MRPLATFARFAPLSADPPDLRRSVCNDAIGETPDGRKIGDSSNLVIDADADSEVARHRNPNDTHATAAREAK